MAVSYTIVGPYGGADRTIWLDGRPHPPDYAEHTWSGFSTGAWDRGILKVRTTHMKAGYLRDNGVPASDDSELLEYFIRHDDHLTHVQFTIDPAYLVEPGAGEEDGS